MRALAVILGALAAFTTSAGAAGAAPLEGIVLESNARWSHGGARIVTESLVATTDGRRVVLRQPGGTTDGIGMRVIPSPTLLEPGDQIRALTGASRPDGTLPLRAVELRATLPGTRRPTTLPYARTTNETGAQLYWESGCAFMTYDAAGTTHIEGDREFEIMTAALAHWRDSIASCSYFDLVIEDPTEGAIVSFDRINVVKFREDRWCKPEHGDEPEECYDDGAAGLTTLHFVDDESSDRNGAILDADIELNGVNFAISDDDQTLGSPNCKADLANTFTHEVGHLLGLDHTCWRGFGPRAVDHNGDPVPPCSDNLPDEITEATMYNFQECGETKKATVEADDVAGACAIAPLADDPRSCEPVGETGGCCSASGSGSAAGTMLLALVCLAARGRRRRRPAGRCR